MQLLVDVYASNPDKIKENELQFEIDFKHNIQKLKFVHNFITLSAAHAILLKKSQGKLNKDVQDSQEFKELENGYGYLLYHYDKQNILKEWNDFHDNHRLLFLFRHSLKKLNPRDLVRRIFTNSFKNTTTPIISTFSTVLSTDLLKHYKNIQGPSIDVDDWNSMLVHAGSTGVDENSMAVDAVMYNTWSNNDSDLQTIHSMNRNKEKSRENVSGTTKQAVKRKRTFEKKAQKIAQTIKQMSHDATFKNNVDELKQQLQTNIQESHKKRKMELDPKTEYFSQTPNPQTTTIIPQNNISLVRDTLNLEKNKSNDVMIARALIHHNDTSEEKLLRACSTQSCPTRHGIVIIFNNLYVVTLIYCVYTTSHERSSVSRNNTEWYCDTMPKCAAIHQREALG